MKLRILHILVVMVAASGWAWCEPAGPATGLLAARASWLEFRLGEAQRRIYAEVSRCRQLKDSSALMEALSLQGVIALDSGDDDVAEKDLRETEALATAHAGEKQAQAAFYYFRGCFNRRRNWLQRARLDFAAADECGPPRWLST